MPQKNNLARKLSKVPSIRTVAVALSQEDATAYEQQAEQLGVDLGQVLSQRLTETIGYTAEKPLYFNDALRSELEQLLAFNFNSAEEVNARLRSYLSVLTLRAGGGPAEELVLNPNQLVRLAGRANFGATIQEKAKEFALRGINQEIGLY